MNEEKADFAAEVLFYDNGVEEALLKMTNQQRDLFFYLIKEKFCIDCGSDCGQNCYCKDDE